MADKFLKSFYADIQAEEAEMARYRARLAPRLLRPQRMRWLIPLGVTAIAATVLLILLAPAHPTPFYPLTLDQIRTMAAKGSFDMIEEARNIAQSKKSEARWNANLFLCLASRNDRVMDYAAKGIREDPRPQFRSAYIELLLDSADEHRYSTIEIESLMDREYDSTCLCLFRELFRVAGWQEHYLGPVMEQDKGGLKNTIL
jgi:hypothetical protein